MSSYKAPSFQDRIAAAGSAKQKALDSLRAKPPIDAEIMAERRRVQEARDEAAAIKRAAKAEALALAKAEKAERKAARLTPAGAAEMKAARDARYAARKARKK